METVNAPSYFNGNTGYRFISKSKNSFKISIPKPEGGYFYRTLGYLKIGEEQALLNAIKERNINGKKLWGKFWHKVVSDWTLLARLPRSLDPIKRSVGPKQNDSYEYMANWMEKQPDGRNIKKSCRYRCTKYGKLGAYTKAKKKLLEAHEHHMPLLRFMGRAPIVDLK